MHCQVIINQFYYSRHIVTLDDTTNLTDNQQQKGVSNYLYNRLINLSINRVHTTSSLQKVITFYDYFRKKNYDFFMTSAIFLCCGLMFSNDVTH